MNRIRELRRAAGMTGEELAKLVGTNSAQIYKLERGCRKLDSVWMARIAEALGCTAADLLPVALAAESKPDIEDVALDPVLASGMASRGLKAYKVAGRSVVGAGIAPGDTVIVDESRAAIDAAKTGDIVLVRLGPERVVALRALYVGEGISLLLTVRAGANLTVSTNDPAVKPEITGVVVRAKPPTP
jgi:DNA-binding XRE family transcriptional regulator